MGTIEVFQANKDYSIGSEVSFKNILFKVVADNDDSVDYLTNAGYIGCHKCCLYDKKCCTERTFLCMKSLRQDKTNVHAELITNNYKG